MTRLLYGQPGFWDQMTSRRFPPPWTVEEMPGAFKVLDVNGQAIAYIYKGADAG